MIAVILFCAFIAFLYYASENPDKINEKTVTQSFNSFITNKKLEEVDPPKIGKGPYGVKSVVGSFKNISGSKISYAQVTFALLDKDGAQIGTAIANINDLAVDAVWKYSAVPLTTEKWVSFELTDIDTW